MDACRVESYLRSTCAVLDFDIGEFWCVRNIPGQKPLLKFIQLYSSPVFEEFYSLLVRPDTGADHRCDEEKHRFSPIICRGVSDGGKIVWANTCTTQGLVGRSDLPLNTAVGVPMCSIGCDLYVLVLFSLESIRMSQHAMEFLCACTRIVAEPSPCFLPASRYTTVTPAKVEHFIGIWDMVDLMNAYCDDVAFQSLPVDRLQYYFDHQESKALTDIFNDFKQIQNSGFTTKQLNSLRQQHAKSASEADNELVMGRKRSGSATSFQSFGSDQWTITSGISREDRWRQWAAITPASDSASPMLGLPLSARTESDPAVEDNETGHDVPGAFTVDFDTIGSGAVSNSSSVGNTTEELYDSDSMASSGKPSDGVRYRSKRRHGESSNTSARFMKMETFSDYDSVSDCYYSVPIIDVRDSYRKNHSRFHEFMVSLVGLTVFNAVELWLWSDKLRHLCLVAGLHQNQLMNSWTEHSSSLRLQPSIDVPGHVFESGHPYWDKHYDQHNIADPLHPRAFLANTLHVRTAFAIPLPGADSVGGVLAVYSHHSLEVDLVLVAYVVKALQLLSASALDSDVLATMDIESSARMMSGGAGPRRQLEEWHVEVPNHSSGGQSSVSGSGDTIPQTTCVTTLHSTYRNKEGTITLKVTSEAHTDDGTGSSAANTTFTILPMGSLADPSSELASLYHAKRSRGGPGRAVSPKGKLRKIDEALEHANVGRIRQSVGGISSNGPVGFGNSGSCAFVPPLPLYSNRVSSSSGNLSAGRLAIQQQVLQQQQQQQQLLQQQLNQNALLRFQLGNDATNQSTMISHTESIDGDSSSRLSDSGASTGPATTASNAVFTAYSEFQSELRKVVTAPTQTKAAKSKRTVPAAPSPLYPGQLYPNPYQQSSFPPPYPFHAMQQYPGFHGANYLQSMYGVGDPRSAMSFKQAVMNSLTSVDESEQQHIPIGVLPGQDRGPVFMPPFSGSLPDPRSRIYPGNSVSMPKVNEAESSQSRLAEADPLVALANSAAKAVGPQYCHEISSPAWSSHQSIPQPLSESGARRRAPAPVKQNKAIPPYKPQPTSGSGANNGFEVNSGASMGMCQVVGCNDPVGGKGYTMCMLHSTSRRCAAEGCGKCAQGGTGFCISHGGGRRCTFPGCDKGARDKFFCAGHGGGRRCTVPGCSKSAVGGSELCTGHGGGKRCQAEGCTRSAQSRSMLCVRHGGGRKCSVAGCVKVARGRTNYCAAHRNYDQGTTNATSGDTSTSAANEGVANSEAAAKAADDGNDSDHVDDDADQQDD